MADALLRLIRQMRAAAARSSALPVFVTDSTNEDREIADAEADGRIGPDTLVVVIRKFSEELAALPAS